FLTCFFLSRSCVPPALHSFPTRRSSDLSRCDFRARACYCVTGDAARARGGRAGSDLPQVDGVSPRVAERQACDLRGRRPDRRWRDRKSTRLNSSHVEISYAVFCLKKKKQ